MQKKTTLVLHVGPGNTRAILFKEGRIINYKSYRLGAFRTEEAIQSLDLSGNDLLRVIKEHSGGQILALAADFKDLLIQEVVMIGFEIQSLTSSLGKKNSTKIPTQSLQDLCEKFSKYSIDQIVKNYPFDYQAAEAVLPALEINVTIAQSLGIKSIRIPGSDYERGLLTDISNDMGFSSGFEEEVIQSAIQLAQKFQVNIEHATNVCLLCEMFFQKLEHIHHLSSHDLLLLRAAAILHESGGFIQSRAHHKHSLYLISNSEIFGLSQHDVNLIALIARYHRNSGPKPNHTLYRDLSSSEKIRITKLASLLRVADALDRSHLGRIHTAEIHIKKRKLIISLKGISDASVERLAMRSKGDLFQDIFGLEIIIEESSN